MFNPCFSAKLGNYKSSVLHFEKALDQAKLLQDDDAKDAIEKVNTDIPPLLYGSCCCFCYHCQTELTEWHCQLVNI